jgi:hypothetical protein
VHLLVLMSFMSSAALSLQDEVTCPDTAAVLDRLHRIAPQALEADHVAHLRQVEGELMLELDDPGGATLASRRLPVSRDCDQLAEVVAVTLAAWEAQFTLTPTAPPPEAPSTGRAVTSPASTSSALSPEGSAGERQHLLLSALVLGTAENHAGGVAVELGMDLGHLIALLLVEAPHSTYLAPGELHWQRSALGLGGTLGASTGRWDFDGRAFVLGALLARWGSGYSIDQASVSPDVGLGLAGRASFGLGGAWRLVAELSGVAWPLTQRIVVDGVPGTFTLPPFQLFAGLGVGCDFSR